jgi:hypothetical protein
MRVMVSLNLADIMTATRRISPETPNNEVDPTDHNQESHSEQIEDTTESIE